MTGFAMSLRAYLAIRTGLRTGALPRRTPLYDRDLSHALGIPRAHVRDALRGLADEGYLDRATRSGTRFPGRFVDLDSPGDDTGATWEVVDSGRVAPPPGIREFLPAGPVHLDGAIVRVRHEPVALEVAYYSLSSTPATRLADGLAAAERMHAAPQSRRLTTILGPCASRSIVEAGSAGPDLATMLDIAIGAPVILRERCVWTAQGRPAAVVTTAARADRVSLTVPAADAAG